MSYEIAVASSSGSIGPGGLSEAAFDVLLDNLDGMVFRCRDDAEWTMHFVSDGCLRLTGYQPDDLILNNRVSYETITHPDDRRRVRSIIHAAIKSRRRYEVEYRIITAMKSERWVLERGVAVFDSHGQVLALEGLITDITRLKHAEQKAHQAESRYRSLFDNALEGIFRTTIDGRYIDANLALASIYGFDSPTELINCVRDIQGQLYVQPGRRDEFLLQITDYGSVTHFESEIYRKDGERVWISENVRAVRDDTGKLLHFEGTVVDITEQRNYQQSLIEASESAAAASKAKSAFLANVSHEIRTPMNGVIGMTELLLSTKMERTQRDYVETIRASADALLTVINDILDFSKIEAGKLDINPVEMDLRGNVEEVAGMLAFQAAVKNLELIINVSPEVPERVLGDAQRIRQCLINLIGNAIKFTADGEIVITVCTTGQRDGNVHTLFEVRDTGMGIAPETINTLFEPFVQGDASATRQAGGTGLGLSIVRRLVVMMGGEVGVSSELGKGSTFWFTLPFEVAESTSTVSNLRVLPQGHRVLVVDDNQTNQRVVAGHLTHVGYSVALASSGAEALVMLREALKNNELYDVVLIDLRMQDMDGATLGEQINADQQLSQARLVMLTSMDQQGDLQRFRKLGFAGYLAKPLRARELYGCLEQVLARESRDWHTQLQPLVTRHALHDAAASQRFAGRVLLVEDNAVNQVVAKSFLERHGCVVIVAENGAEGVRAYEHGKFDLVFMDMQMPVMDGLTATRKIRDFEGWRPRTPIIALTANAMTGQEDRCLAAGMDDFLTKPLDSSRLRDVLAKYLVRSDGQGTEVTAPSVAEHIGSASTEKDALMSWQRFDELVAGDADFARELLHVFLASSGAILEEVRHALTLSDRMQLQRGAHKLKGASANIGAEVLHKLAHKVEAMTDDQQYDLQVLSAQVLVMDDCAMQTRAEMQRYLDQTSAT